MADPSDKNEHSSQKQPEPGSSAENWEQKIAKRLSELEKETPEQLLSSQQESSSSTPSWQEALESSEFDWEKREREGVAFPWKEFLFGLMMGFLLLIVIFLFFINYSRNINKRLTELEHNTRMLFAQTNSDWQQEVDQKLFFLQKEIIQLRQRVQQLSSQSSSHGSVVEKIQKRLESLESQLKDWHEHRMQVGEVEIVFAQESLQFTTQVIFQQSFAKAPYVFASTSHPALKVTLAEIDSDGFRVQVKRPERLPRGDYLLSWVAIVKKTK